MSLAVAIQMDPIDTINIDADSTFALALEAQARGHALFHYLPEALTLHDGRLYARARPLEVFRRDIHHHRFGPFEELDLAGVDVILMRQDPPFDMAYITATHLLELLPGDGPLVVNDPAAVRNAPEKLFVLRFKELMPPTLLTRDRDAIRAFWKEYGDIILKPLFGNGGAGVFRLRPGDENLTALLEIYESIQREPVMVQRYLPVSDRDVLLRLQNNLKARLLQAQRHERAVGVVETMLMLAPDLAELWREAGILHARLGSMGAAAAALEQFVLRAPDGMARHQAAAMLQQLRSKLN